MNREMEYLPFADVDERGWVQRSNKWDYAAAVLLLVLLFGLALLLYYG